jgi:hypothetical protein
MLTVGDLGSARLGALLAGFGLHLRLQPDGMAITGSYWGDPEAGIAGRDVYAHEDTPVHSVLHEACHLICMPAGRRDDCFRDAGGDDLEEAAVCYLQIVLADRLEGVGRERLLRDMDAWGYSFRLGSATAWFDRDAEDARLWLIDKELLKNDGTPTFRLRA